MTVTKTTRSIVLFFTLRKKVERGGEEKEGERIEA
jgi:hypothetical protein